MEWKEAAGKENINFSISPYIGMPQAILSQNGKDLQISSLHSLYSQQSQSLNPLKEMKALLDLDSGISSLE